MPIITIEMLEGRSIEQKRELVKAITEDVCRIAPTEPDAVTIIIHEVKRENLAKSGRLKSET